MGGMRIGDWSKRQWSDEQVQDLNTCFQQALGTAPSCSWREAQCSSKLLQVRFPPAQSDAACADACCSSGAECAAYAFSQNTLSCFLGVGCKMQSTLEDDTVNAISAWE